MSESDDWRKEIDSLRAQLAKLEEKFPCGHRKVDWDDSYGECVACHFIEMAGDYDRLPHTVIECHDKIEGLQYDLAIARADK